MAIVQVSLAVLVLCAMANADVYLHNMRGSNNRLDEANRDRDNGNRLFDSQNNNRGGSNVGSLYFYEGERIPLEWTNQHGCGNDYNDCQMVIQYMCDDRLRDGVTTRTIPDQPSNCLNNDCNNDVRYGMHEDYDYYMNCKYRYRNRGLFTADRNLNGNTARFTRQNENGNRRGYECPEERDHYPYWHPSPWIDIAIFTNDASRCDFYVNQSENVLGRHYCSLPDSWYHSMVSRGGNGNNGFIPNTKPLCDLLNLPTSPMKQFLQAKAQAFFDRVQQEAKDEFEACQTKAAECTNLADDPTLFNNCMKAFLNNMTVAELDAAVSFCKAGFEPHPYTDCPVCLQTAACPAGSLVLANITETSTSVGCPSAAYKLDEANPQYCILQTCNATRYNPNTDDLEAYDNARNAALGNKYLIESSTQPLCRSRLSLSANCVRQSTRNAVWTQAPSHQERLPFVRAPFCRESQWSRPNHLGNGIGGEQNGHNISIPAHFHENCALRVRYNITTGVGDYNGRNPHNSGLVNSTLNKNNGNNPAKINVAAEHGIPTTNSDRPWENARGYLFRQNPQVQIFDFEVLVQYCDDSRANVPNDTTKCFVLNSGVPTTTKTTAQGVYCPDGFTAGVARTGVNANKDGTCALTCLSSTGATAPRRRCQSQASGEKDFVLQLAINTNQFGRTFQDRTHSYAMRERTEELKDQCDAIYALNVRGKRGNIVQTYPGTEYDFTPNTLHVAEGDCVHFQWTGSNTNPNNNDGQGKQGTDRHNVALLEQVRGEGGRGVEGFGGKGRGGTTWTTADMEPGWEGFVLNARPTMADRQCPWKRTSTTAVLHRFVHPFDFKKCVACDASNWVNRPFTLNEEGQMIFGACPAGFQVDFGVFGVTIEKCVRSGSPCVPATGDAFIARNLAPTEYMSGLDNHDPTFKGYPATQIGVPKALKRGQWGMSHPEHFDNVTRMGFLGLTRDQLLSLATLNNVQFRGEMSELDDAGTYYDLPVHKVSGVGTYYYLCTRNNNFSNRSQKAKIVVSEAKEESNVIGSPGGVIVMKSSGGFIREPETVQEMIESADFSIEVPRNSLTSAVPIQMKVFPGATHGMKNAASDVLWVGPGNLAGIRRIPQLTLTPEGSRRRADEPNLTASFKVVSASAIWFRIHSTLFDEYVASHPLQNSISFQVEFRASNLAPIAPFSVELNNANELEGQWINMPPEYVRTVESGNMWVFVTVDGVVYRAQIVVEETSGQPMTIRMPVSVTLTYGNVYYFRNQECIMNFVKGCEFERQLVEDASISGGQAVFQRGGSQTQPAGGFYQVSSGNNLPIIVGVTVACVVLAMVAVGSAVYFRKHPEDWENFKGYGPKKYRALKRSFASQV